MGFIFDSKNLMTGYHFPTKAAVVFPISHTLPQSVPVTPLASSEVSLPTTLHQSKTQNREDATQCWFWMEPVTAQVLPPTLETLTQGRPSWSLPETEGPLPPAKANGKYQPTDLRAPSWMFSVTESSDWLQSSLASHPKHTRNLMPKPYCSHAVARIYHLSVATESSCAGTLVSSVAGSTERWSGHGSTTFINGLTLPWEF